MYIHTYTFLLRAYNKNACASTSSLYAQISLYAPASIYTFMSRSTCSHKMGGYTIARDILLRKKYGKMNIRSAALYLRRRVLANQLVQRSGSAGGGRVELAPAAWKGAKKAGEGLARALHVSSQRVDTGVGFCALQLWKAQDMSPASFTPPA